MSRVRKQQKAPDVAGLFEESDADEVEFDDMDDEEEEEFDDDDVEEDFEQKAAKYKELLLREGRIDQKEQQSDRQRFTKSTVLADVEQGGDAEEDLQQQTIARFGQAHRHSADELRDRVRETIAVLVKFNENREEERSRDEYLALLKNDFIELFEYNEYLMERIMELFPPHEAFEFLEAMEKERPVTIRCNTIKAKRRDLVQALTKRGINVEPLEKWSKVGMQVFESNVPISGTVEYLAGHYMLQSAVSFLPVVAMQPGIDERILDMAAAPGGKTTYICQCMKNTGIVFANDVSEPRCKALSANVQRLGITNCMVTNYDGCGYERFARGFDRVLLDAPCTGTGIISRDKSIKTSKTHIDVQRASHLQRRLLLSAIDSAKAAKVNEATGELTGGVVIYSTCSFLVEENEAVVDYILRRRHVQIEDTGLPFGRPGLTKYRFNRFHDDVSKSRRYLPHVHNMDGFYVCRIRKLKDGEKTGTDADAAGDAPEEKAPRVKLAGRKRAQDTEQDPTTAPRTDAKSTKKETEMMNHKVSVPPAAPSSAARRSAAAKAALKQKRTAKKVAKKRRK